jgi:hypothetical protein
VTPVIDATKLVYGSIASALPSNLPSATGPASIK